MQVRKKLIFPFSNSCLQSGQIFHDASSFHFLLLTLKGPVATGTLMVPERHWFPWLPDFSHSCLVTAFELSELTLREPIPVPYMWYQKVTEQPVPVGAWY